MSRSRSVKKAEERAYAGENEVPDSQIVFDEFQAKYGIGTLSSSPRFEAREARSDQWPQLNWSLSPRSALFPNQEDRGRGAPNENPNASFGPRLARAKHPHAQWNEAASADQRSHHERSASVRRRPDERASPSPPSRRQPRGAAGPDTRPWQEFDDAGPSHKPPPPRPSVLLLKRRMDFSDSPTQSNPDRSYEDYRVTQGRPSASSPPDDDGGPDVHSDAECQHETQQTQATDDRQTLHEDDTGAVNFNLVQFEDSQEDETGLVNFDLDPFPQGSQANIDFSDAATESDPEADHEHHDGDSQDEAELPPVQPWARPRVPLAHCRTSSNSMPPPQTPILGSRVFGKSPLLEGSQMFTQTSGIKKAQSPTSSRPSPRIFPNNFISPNPKAISSPLRDRGLRTSPPPGATSSPDFTLTAREPVDFEHETDTVPASPPFKPRNTRRIPEPISHLVRSSPSLGAEPSRSDSVDFDSESDEELRIRMRSRRVRRIKEDVARSLSVISFSRPSSREDERIVVPSTNREKKRPGPRTPAQQYLDQCHGKHAADKGDTQPSTMADSQGVTTKDGEADAAEGSSNDVEPALQDSQGPAELPRPEQRSGKNTKTPRVPAIDAIAASSGRDMIPETSPAPITNGLHKLEHFPSNQSTQSGSSSVPLQSTAARSSDSQVVHPSGIDVLGTDPRGTAAEETNASSAIEAPGPDEQATDTQLNESLPSTQAPDGNPADTRSQGVEQERTAISPEPEAHEVAPSTEPQEASKPEAEQCSVNTKHGEASEPIHSTPPVSSVAAPSSQPIRRSGRVRNMATPSAERTASPADVPRTSSSSSLSELTSTPVVSPSLTPNTENLGRDELDNPPASSPAVARLQRKVQPRASVVTYSPSRRKQIGLGKQGGMRRSSVRSLRQSSVSTDELAASPGSVSDTRTRCARSLKLVKDIPQAPSGLFQGMVFAISFQSNDEKGKKQAETWIRQQGGKILGIGFNELFEPGSFALPAGDSAPLQPTSLELVHEARDAGFTALIADNHSRKVKYMQALALGLPCLSWKWVSACIAKNKLVDWSSYVLCAGSSMVLGNAIRSRSLPVYDAASARLQDVIGQRPKLLNRTEILLVMKKTKSEEKRMPYVFLSQILGAALIRAHTLDEARAKLRDREEAGQPFDWVYIDDHEAGVAQALFGEPGQSSSRKRKRASAGISSGGRAPKRIRMLTDELVVQSLILGRLVEEGEIEE